jgi:4-alpha-glucanotransferase
MQIWQVLPLVPPGRPIPGLREDYWSPYSGRDAHCGNTLIISLQALVKDGLLTQKDLPHPYDMRGNVDFNQVAKKNEPVIARAANNLLALPDDNDLKAAYLAWRQRPEISRFLTDASLFDAICKTPELLGKDWWDWPVELRARVRVGPFPNQSDCLPPLDVYTAVIKRKYIAQYKTDTFFYLS